jgi:hypothetical protein
MRKTALSFYLDDTNPYDAPAEALKEFLDFCSSEGIRGESSIILGFGAARHGLLSRPQTDQQRAFLHQVRRAYDCGLDGHMELMTHGSLFDFDAGSAPSDAIHEGLWLHEPAVSVDAYESYFEHIAQEAEQVGLAFTGVTWPGCDCAACNRRYAELRRVASSGVNPNVWTALRNLARRNRFRGNAIPCFTFSGPKARPTMMAGDGRHGVWDLMPNVGDQLGSYTNSQDKVDPDYYITADGTAGRVVELAATGEPHCIFYAHWQGLNPFTGVGWQAFIQVVQRIQKHLGDRVEWLKPSDYASRLQAL